MQVARKHDLICECKVQREPQRKFPYLYLVSAGGANSFQVQKINLKNYRSEAPSGTRIWLDDILDSQILLTWLYDIQSKIYSQLGIWLI